MESEIKDILIQKLKEKNVRKFNGYTLGLHANHIANAILRKRGIKKGSAEYTAEHPKLKQMIKDIHKALEPQAVTKKEAPAPSITPAQLAKETSSVEAETVVPAPKESEELKTIKAELKALKAELKALKATLASSKDVKAEMASKIQDMFRRYKEMKYAKSQLESLKESKQVLEGRLGEIKESIQYITAVKRVQKALKKNVEKVKEARAKEPNPREKRRLESENRKKALVEYRKSLDPRLSERLSDNELENRYNKYQHVEDPSLYINRDNVRDQFLNINTVKVTNVIDAIGDKWFEKHPGSAKKFPNAFKHLFDTILLYAVEHKSVGEAKEDYKKLFNMLKGDLYKVLPKEKIDEALKMVKDKNFSRYESDIRDLVVIMNKLIRYFKVE